MDEFTPVTLAEAHLYTGIAKADGLISELEFAQIPFYAEKSHKFYEKMNLSSSTVSRISNAIRSVMVDPVFRSLTPAAHLEKACDILRVVVKQGGGWDVRIAFNKNEQGFTDSAKIDGYVIKEANFIHLIEKKIAELFV